MGTEAKIKHIFDLFDKFGHENYIGESVTQLQHAQQCALEAQKSGQPDHVVLGAFLHDIGHLIGMEKNMKQMEAFGITLGIMTHEKIGETFLKDLGFPASVTDFVRGHVEAKRYLVFKNPDYHATLSKASQGTLINQGGPMTALEAATFEQHPDFKALIEMRLWDDRAKNKSIPATENKYYQDLCRKVLFSQ